MPKRYALKTEVMEAVGTVLYGPNWQRQLARSLGVSEMSIRRWRTNQTTMPADAVAEMAALLVERKREIAATHERLRGALAA